MPDKINVLIKINIIFINSSPKQVFKFQHYVNSVLTSAITASLCWNHFVWLSCHNGQQKQQTMICLLNVVQNSPSILANFYIMM